MIRDHCLWTGAKVENKMEIGEKKKRWLFWENILEIWMTDFMSTAINNSCNDTFYEVVVSPLKSMVTMPALLAIPIKYRSQ
jgi:hypothetical protein